MKEQLISEFCVKACEAAPDPKGAYDLSMVCEIADQLLRILHPDIEIHDVTDPGGTVRYTEVSQDLFETYLSEVECALEEVGLTYDFPDCIWVVKGTADA